MEQIAATYLKALNIPVSKRYCERLVMSHPEYPSLLSLSDTFTRLGIDHQAARIPRSEVAHLSFPYILQVDEKSSEFSLIKQEKDLDLLNDSEQPSSKVVVLQVDKTETIRDQEAAKEYANETFRKVCYVLLLTALSGIFLLSLVQNLSWFYTVLLVTALTGAVSGYFLFAKDLGIRYDTVEALCNSGTRANCDRLLFSEDARIIGSLTFSDATVSYFVFQLLVLGLILPVVNITGSFLAVLATLSGLTLPVVLYSLYIQAVKVKIWCRLCLIVDGVLLLQAAMFAGMIYAGFLLVTDLNLIVAGLSVLLLIAVISLVSLLKQQMEESNRAARAEVTAKRVQYTPSIFMHLLQKSERVDVSPFQKELVIGNKAAPVNIMMAGSLGCSPCKNGFEKALQVVTAYPNLTCLSIRFLHNMDTNGDPSSIPGVHLIDYWLKRIHGDSHESEKTEKLIRDWYSLMNLKRFKEVYPKAFNKSESQDEALQLSSIQTSWFEEAGITGTPTFILNGFRLPEPYRIEDLMVLVPGLSDPFHSNGEQHNKEILSKEMSKSV